MREPSFRIAGRIRGIEEVQIPPAGAYRNAVVNAVVPGETFNSQPVS